MANPYLLIVAAIIVLILNPCRVRAQAFTNESTTLEAGYGFGTFTNSLSKALDQFTDVKHTEFGPIYFKAERGVTDHIGIGLSFAYVQDRWKYNYGNGYTETDNRTSYSVLARLNFHIGNSKKIDPYCGFGLGYRNAIWTSSTTSPQGNSGIDLQTFIPLGFELTLGVRYLITPNFAVYTEWGGAKSVFQLGAGIYLPGIARTVTPLIRP